jgi:hypothetical protein
LSHLRSVTGLTFSESQMQVKSTPAGSGSWASVFILSLSYHLLSCALARLLDPEMERIDLTEFI